MYQNACVYGLHRVVKYCIDNGADIHVYGDVELRQAKADRKFNLLKILIKANNGITPESVEQTLFFEP